MASPNSSPVYGQSTRLQRPSWFRRALRFLFLRLLPAALFIIAAVLGVQVVSKALRLNATQAEISARVPFYRETATALASASGAATAEAVPPGSAGKLRHDWQLMQAFVTNTPAAIPAAPAPAEPTQAPAGATATPPPAEPAEVAPDVIPTLDGTPRPLPTLWVYGQADPNDVAPTAIPTPVEALDRQGMDLVNIVLLGNDNEITREEVARTDTVMVVSVNRTAGTVSLISFPRDLYVYIPGWTMQRINAAFPYGETVGFTDGGFGLLRQTLFYNFGINVHYYAMVNLTGFKALVDAVGGVNLSVDCAIEDLRLVGTELPTAAYRVNEEGYWVLPVGRYQMTGAEALWYARSRHNSSDFDRGRRQQQVVRAVWRQARNDGLLASVPTLWNELSPYVETNLAFEDILGLLPVAANLDPTRIESFDLVRTYHTTPWQTPDGDYVQLPVYDTLRPLLQDFYTPPTASQVAAEAPTISIYNGTANAGWDQVAADRLAWEGFGVTMGGDAPTLDVAQTTLVDYTAQTKGSSLEAIARALNINPSNIRLDPRTDRTVDFEVVLGADYNSCDTQGVLPVSTPTGG